IFPGNSFFSFSKCGCKAALQQHRGSVKHSTSIRSPAFLLSDINSVRLISYTSFLNKLHCISPLGMDELISLLLISLRALSAMATLSWVRSVPSGFRSTKPLVFSTSAKGSSEYCQASPIWVLTPSFHGPRKSAPDDIL